MLKHFSAVTSVLFFLLFSAGSVFAQDTPQSALDNGDTAKASALLESMSADSDIEKTVESLCGQTQIAIEQGDFAKASQLLETLDAKKANLKKKNGWNVVILWLKAESAHRQNDEATYKSMLKKALDAIDSGAKVEDSWEGSLNYMLSVIETDNSDAREYAELAIESLHSSKLHYEEGLANLRLAELEWNRNKQRRAFIAYDAALKAFRSASNDNIEYKIAQTQLIIASRLIEASEIKSAKARLEIAKKEIESAGNPADLIAMMNDISAKIPE